MLNVWISLRGRDSVVGLVGKEVGMYKGAIALVVLVTVFSMLMCASGVFAQEEKRAPMPGPSQGPGQGPGKEGSGRPDPGETRQEMLDIVRQSVDCTDEEWKTIQPSFEKVQNISMQIRPGGFRMGGVGPGIAGAATGGPTTDVQRKTLELKNLIENKDTTPEAIKKGLDDLRLARKSAREELDKAQEECRKGLTPKQEAQFVVMGLLD